MRVKVIKAGLKSYWYADLIGKTFEVEPFKDESWGFKLVSDWFHGSYFAKDDVEIINEEKEMQFTKDMLRTGMRVVHGNHSRDNAKICIVVKDLNKIMFADGSWNYLSSYAEDMTMSGGIWDITEVYDCPDSKVLDFTVNSQPLIWKRDTQTPEQKQLDILMKQITELQGQAEKLQGLINK